MGEKSDILARIAGRTVVASISGGKDSTAMALHLMELGVDFEAIHCETGWEHPDTEDYLDRVLEPKIGPITRLKSGKGGMVDLVRSRMMFPSRTIRFCTQELKIFPVRDYINAHDSECLNAVGVRAAESRARARLPEWEHWKAADVEVWRPIFRWSFDDVTEIHRRHNLEPNPLYFKGASRVGCWPCIFAKKSDVRLVAHLSPERIDEIRDLEEEITRGADERAAKKGETNKNPRTWFMGRGPASRGGNRGPMPIDDVIEWSKTSRGGEQYELFEPGDLERGCMRWGMCDAGSSDG